MEIFIPKEVSFLIDTIYENGYEAFMVGGCVRDSILNLTPMIMILQLVQHHKK